MAHSYQRIWQSTHLPDSDLQISFVGPRAWFAQEAEIQTNPLQSVSSSPYDQKGWKQLLEALLAQQCLKQEGGKQASKLAPTAPTQEKPV